MESLNILLNIRVQLMASIFVQTQAPKSRIFHCWMRLRPKNFVQTRPLRFFSFLYWCFRWCTSQKRWPPGGCTFSHLRLSKSLIWNLSHGYDSNFSLRPELEEVGEVSTLEKPEGFETPPGAQCLNANLTKHAESWAHGAPGYGMKMLSGPAAAAVWNLNVSLESEVHWMYIT